MTREKIINTLIATLEQMRPSNSIPNPKTRGRTSTGNLAFNALRYEIQGDKFIVYVDSQIAPYMPYTNEPWTAKRWNNKKNPNEGWWERFANEYAQRVAAKLGGHIKR